MVEGGGECIVGDAEGWGGTESDNRCRRAAEVVEELGEVGERIVLKGATTRLPFVLYPSAHFVRKFLLLDGSTVQHCYSYFSAYYYKCPFVRVVFWHYFVD